MTSEEKVKRVFPDAHVSQFGYMCGRIHIVTNEQGPQRYKSADFPQKFPKSAWKDAWKRIVNSGERP